MHSAESVALEMHQTVRCHVSLYRDGEGLQRAWERVGRLYGLTGRRVRAYWNAEVRTVPAHEADAIRAAKRVILRERQKKLNHELETLQMRLAQMGEE